MRDSEVEMINRWRNKGISGASVCLLITNSKRVISTRSGRIPEACTLNVCDEVEVKFHEVHPTVMAPCRILIWIIHARGIIVTVLLVVSDVVPLFKVLEWARFPLEVVGSVQNSIECSVINGSTEISYDSFGSLETMEENECEND